MTEPDIQLMATGDGSHSLYHADLDESYHSHHGALRESQFVYIDQGLTLLPPRPTLRVLEVGLGTGLNVLLTARAQQQRPESTVTMTSLEPYPIPTALIDQLNYCDLLECNAAERALFQAIHQCPWQSPQALTTGFTFTKLNQRLEDWAVPEEPFDIVYYDAFAPSKQADIWAQTNLDKCAAALRPGGLLVTYCAQGAFKRNLRAAGFELGPRLPGPPGKKEMVRAVKPS